MRHLRPYYTVALAVVSISTSASADQIIPDDLIVQGSLCVGLDCVNGENFDFDTIRLKENNTRIQFDDTSSVSGFPTNNWQIRANSSASGGPSFLAFFDQGATGNSETGTQVFTVSAGARANALFLSNTSRVGLGTSAPVLELHIKDGDTPSIRLEQDNTSGFTPQTWDIAGNETNFFIRDATGGSALPFRIRPAAPSNSIFVDTDGDVGIGTSNPNISSADDDLVILDSGPARLALISTSAANTVWTFNSNNTLRISAGADAAELVLDDNGNMTILGALTQNSDKNNKMAIEPIDPGAILEKVAALPVSAWTYKHDAEDGIRHIGPMAQDFYALFGTGASETGISTLDTSGVALAAIQALRQENAELRGRLEVLEIRIAE